MAKTSKKTKTDPTENKPYREEVETFSKPNLACGRFFVRKTPDAFNGIVDVRRYKVVAEVIDEPIEDIHARIIDLWERSDNYHQLDPLKKTALEYGLELDISTFGKNRKTKK